MSSIKFNSYLLLFLPLALISGPFFSDLIIVFSMFLLIFYFEKKVFINILKNKLVISFILLWFVSIISSLFSSDIFFSLKSSLFYFRFIIFFIVIYFILSHDELILKKFLNILILIFVILFIDASFQKFFGKNLIGIEISHNVRISSFFADELILGSYLVKFYPLLIGLTYLFYKNRFIFIFMLISFFTFVTIILSAEKTAIIIFCIEYFLILIFYRINIKFKISFLFLPILFLSFMLLIFPNIKDRVFTKLLANSENMSYAFSITHHQHYLSAYKVFKEYPIIGVGPKMFRNYCKDERFLISKHSCTTHPHNYSMQLLSETGVLGFLAFISIYLILIIDFFKILFSKNYNQYVFTFYTVIILNLVNLMPLFPSGSFFNNWISISYSIPVGFYLYFKLKLSNK